MSYTVQLTYFRPNGKYAAEGSYTSDKTYMFEIFAEVRRMAEEQRLPGLISGHSWYNVLVTCPAHPNEFPHMIMERSVSGVLADQDMRTRLDQEVERTVRGFFDAEDNVEMYEEYRRRAREQYHEDGAIRIAESAQVSQSEEGAYVQAWVWVEDESE